MWSEPGTDAEVCLRLPPSQVTSTTHHLPWAPTVSAHLASMLCLRPRPPPRSRYLTALFRRPLSSHSAKIYTSPHPSIPTSSLPRTSLFAHLFPSPSATVTHPLDLSPTLPAFVDSSSGETLTRGDVLSRAHELARALHARRPRGTAGMFMGNGLDWPSVFAGCQKAGWKTALFAGSL